MLVTVVLFLCLAAFSSACSCDYRKLDDYCKYSVVVFGKAIDERIEGDARIYTFSVHHQFKPFEENNGKTIELRTPYRRTSCDTSLVLNQNLFVMANKHDDGTIWFWYCDPRVLWDNRSSQHMVENIRDNVVPHCGLQPPTTPQMID